MAEAGFFPGIILYLTYWFPARERARIVALFMAAVQLGIAALFFLDDGPRHARWLETGYHELGDALTRPRVLVLALLYFCIVVGLYGIGFWMPQVIQAYGRTPLAIGFLTAIPYLFAAIGMVLWAGIRIRPASAWHIAIPLIVGGAAFAWSAASLPLSLTMVALTFATLGIYCAIGTFWSLPTAILTGTGAAAGLALVNSVGNLGGLVGPTIVGIMKQGSGDFMGALMFPRRGVGARRRDHPAVRPCGTQARHRGSCHDPLRRVVQ